MAPGWNATSLAPIAATVGQWFDHKRGLALNLALSGATVAGLVVAPALLAVIPRTGFRRRRAVAGGDRHRRCRRGGGAVRAPRAAVAQAGAR